MTIEGTKISGVAGLSGIIDSHVHLDYPQFEGRLDEVMARAGELGVREMISIGVKISTAEKPRYIAETFENVWFSAGIHPHEAAAESCDLEAVLKAADHPKCVAIGEAGLDYHYDYAPRAIQANMFRMQIEAARQTGLPLIVHARSADEDMAAILEEEMQKGAFMGVLHCFSSGADLARRALAIGFYVSFSGILTFNKAEELREIAGFVDEGRVLVETDAPYLAPVPHRGGVNEPGFTRYVLNRLAEIKGKSQQDMAEITRRNTLNLFSKMKCDYNNGV